MKALSPNLRNQLLSRAPASFLNPGTTYYWTVRARHSNGEIGEWSLPFQFQTAGGAK